MLVIRCGTVPLAVTIVGMIVAAGLAVVSVRMAVVVRMAMSRSVGMHMLMGALLIRALLVKIATCDCRHCAGLQIQYSGFRVSFAPASRAHYTTSSNSMLLTFNSSPTTR